MYIRHKWHPLMNFLFHHGTKFFRLQRMIVSPKINSQVCVCVSSMFEVLSPCFFEEHQV